MKKHFLAVFAVLFCMTGCRVNVGTDQSDTEQAVLESQQTTAEVTTEQTIKITETTTEATTLTTVEEASEDIAVSREYEFDLEKYLERPNSKNYLLRDELDFLSDEQYDTYIRAWIMLNSLLYFNVPSTSDAPTYFIDKNGEISESHTVQELDKTHIYPYYYVSTYQSFYEYLQSVFTQEAVDDIMLGTWLLGGRDEFLRIGDELYCKLGDRGGAIYFNEGEYNLTEKNDDEVIFEYIAHQSKDGNEWTETRPIKLVHTNDGWRSEFFDNLYVERNMPYQYMVDVDLSEDYDYGREYEFDLDKYLERSHTEQYLLRDELDFLSDEQYDTYIKAWIFIDSMDTANGSTLPQTNAVKEDWYYYPEISLYSSYISTYESFYEYLRTVFTKESADEIVSGVNFYNADGELFYIAGEAGGYLERIEGKYELVEKTDSEVVFEYNARHIYDNGTYGYEDGTYIDTTRTIKLVNEGDGWRAELFPHLLKPTKDEIRELSRHSSNAEKTVIVAGQEFSVDESSITISADLNTDISNIKYLSGLKELKLVGSEGYSSVTGFSNISYLENLEALTINTVETDDMNSVSECKKLKKFSLEFNGADDLSFLKDISGLEELYLCNVSVSDISFLKNLKNLKKVSIIEAVNITDFESLCYLDNAEYLYISCNDISDEQLNAIKNFLPNCEVK